MQHSTSTTSACTFDALTSRRISELIDRAHHTIVYVAPGMNLSIAEAILRFCQRVKPHTPELVIDCSEEACRLGYGEIEAVRSLTKAGCVIRQASGLRIGVLICDSSAWCFSPTPLCIEEEMSSPTMPNAIGLLPQQAQALLQALCPRHALPTSLFDDPTPQDGEANVPEIGQAVLTTNTLTAVEKGLEVAPCQFSGHNVPGVFTQTPPRVFTQTVPGRGDFCSRFLLLGIVDLSRLLTPRRNHARQEITDRGYSYPLAAHPQQSQ